MTFKDYFTDFLFIILSMTISVPIFWVATNSFIWVMIIAFAIGLFSVIVCRKTNIFM